MTIIALIACLALWFIGVLIDSGSSLGLTYVLPFLGMGAFILEAMKKKEEKDE